MKKLANSSRKKRRRLWWFLLVFFVFFLVIVFSLFKFFLGQLEWAGLTVSNIYPNLIMEFGLPPGEEGVVVRSVEESVFYNRLREGDLIKSINGIPVKNIREFRRVARLTNLREGVLFDIIRRGRPLFVSLDKNNTNSKDDSSRAAGLVVSSSATPLAMQVAFTQSRLPSPREQRASQKILVEGHWLGMEMIPLVPELAKEFGISPDQEGILVDEVSLEAAESGLLAGDMILSVNGLATPNLKAFTDATRSVQNRKSARILVTRKGRVLELTIRSEQNLGFSQNEAAQPIKPGALSPHRSRNKPCTACHIIMLEGGQLPTDAGDILPSPPPIIKGTVLAHEPRGNCKNCHAIITQQ